MEDSLLLDPAKFADLHPPNDYFPNNQEDAPGTLGDKLAHYMHSILPVTIGYITHISTNFILAHAQLYKLLPREEKGTHPERERQRERERNRE